MRICARFFLKKNVFPRNFDFEQSCGTLPPFNHSPYWPTFFSKQSKIYLYHCILGSVYMRPESTRSMQRICMIPRIAMVCSSIMAMWRHIIISHSERCFDVRWHWQYAFRPGMKGQVEISSIYNLHVQQLLNRRHHQQQGNNRSTLLILWVVIFQRMMSMMCLNQMGSYLTMSYDK